MAKVKRGLRRPHAVRLSGAGAPPAVPPAAPQASVTLPLQWGGPRAQRWHYLVARGLLAARAAARLKIAAPGWWMARAVHAHHAATLPDVTGAQPTDVLRYARLAGRPTWDEAHPITSNSGLVVAAVGPSGRAPMGVVKVARSDEAVAELKRDADVRAALRQDPRLSEWSRLLPDVLAGDLGSVPAFTVERYRGASDGRLVMSGASPAAREAGRAALAAIAELHGRTARRLTAGDDLVAEWADRPVGVAASLYEAGSWQRDALRCLRGRLARGLAEGTPLAGWAHGDYCPPNLLYSRSATGWELSGIVDWGGGSPNGLLEVDTWLLVMTTVTHRERLDLGGVMARLLAGPPSRLAAFGADAQAEDHRWEAHLRCAFEWHRYLAEERPDGGPTGGPGRMMALAQRQEMLLWLAWLQHIARNLTKSQHYRRLRGWRMANVDLVLANVPAG